MLVFRDRVKIRRRNGELERLIDVAIEEEEDASCASCVGGGSGGGAGVDDEMNGMTESTD